MKEPELDALNDPDIEQLVGQIADEFAERKQRGEKPDIDEYVARYPDMAPVLRSVLPTIQAMCNLSSSDEVNSGEDVSVSGQLGDYKILRQIGRGGMGIVYEAEQLSIGRKVALKILPFAAVLDQRQLRRFKNEVQAAGKLHHTNIVPVFSVGCERGVHYYAMQYIEGQTLGEVIKQLRGMSDGSAGPSSQTDAEKTDDNNLPVTTETVAADSLSETFPVAHLSTDGSTRSRLYFQNISRIGEQAADALEHAHIEGITHRDIKPSNLLLDAHGKVWVTDFGLARIEAEAGLTTTGDILGTLRYMSPEQALGKSELDNRTDIYSLGLTLYELITLHHAFPGDQRQRLLNKITNEEPVAPRKLNDSIPAPLETIVLKAIAKNPKQRYQTAAELCDDLRRFREDQPIRARRPTVSEHLSRWSRRHRVALVASGAVTFIAMIAGLVFLVAHNRMMDRQNALLKASIAEATELRRVERRREIQMTLANGVRLVDQGDLLWALPWLAHALKLEDPADPIFGQHYLLTQAVLQGCPRPTHIWFQSDAFRCASFSPDGRLTIMPESPYSVIVRDAQTGKPVLPPLAEKFRLFAAKFTPDGKYIVLAGHQKIQVYEVASGKRIGELLQPGFSLRAIDFSSDSKRMLLAGILNAEQSTANVFELATGKVIGPAIELDQTVRVAKLSPKGDVIAIGAERIATLWDARSRKRLQRIRHAHAVTDVDFSRDGQLVATASLDGSVTVWNTRSLKQIARLIHRQDVKSVRFSPDGLQLLTASSDRMARIWSLKTRTPVIAPLEHNNIVERALFDAVGRRVITVSMDGSVRIWNAKTGKPISPSLVHGAPVHTVNVSPDQRKLLVATREGVVRLWDLSSSLASETVLQHDHVIFHAGFSPDGTRVVTASYDKTARVWDAASGRAITPPLRHESHVYRGEFSPDGKRVLTCSSDYTARIWNADTGEQLQILRHEGTPRDGQLTEPDGVRDANFSPDGKLVATCGFDKAVRIWETGTGKPLAVIENKQVVRHVDFSPSGKLLAVAADDGRLTVRSTADFERVIFEFKHPARVFGFTFSKDSRLLAVASSHDAHVWDLSSGELHCPLLSHHNTVTGVAFDPDGRRLVTSSNDNTARVWDLATGEPLGPALQHRFLVRCASFNRDGKLVLTSSRDQTARVWDAETGIPLSLPLKHQYWIEHCEFSPDGKFVLTASNDNTARIWSLSPFTESDVRSPEQVINLAHLLSAHRIDETGTVAALEREQLEQSWNQFTARFPKEFKATTDQFLTWHAREAESFYWSKQFPGAEHHFTKLIDAGTAGWRHFYLRGNVRASQGHWRAAVDDYLAAEQKGAARSAVASRINTVAWLLATHRDKSVRDARQSVELAQLVIDLDPTLSAHWTSLGVAHCRNGNWDEAIEALIQSDTLQRGRLRILNGFFLAIAHWNKGAQEQAHNLLDQSVKWMESNLPNNSELIRFRNEAQEVLGKNKI